MSANIVVITPTPLEQRTLKEFITSQGGVWNEEPTLNQGAVVRDSAYVFVSCNSIADEGYEAEELAEMAHEMGAAARAVIDIHVGKGAGSCELAMEFAQRMVDCWGGLVRGAEMLCLTNTNPDAIRLPPDTCR